MLELRPNCEMCDRDLPPHALEARICSYECTFCAECVEVSLHNVCPNCGGGFAPRPIRPRGEHRPGAGLRGSPASERRRALRWSAEEVAAFAATLKDTPPAAR